MHSSTPPFDDRCLQPEGLDADTSAQASWRNPPPYTRSAALMDLLMSATEYKVLDEPHRQLVYDLSTAQSVRQAFKSMRYRSVWVDVSFPWSRCLYAPICMLVGKFFFPPFCCLNLDGSLQTPFFFLK